MKIKLYAVGGTVRDRLLGLNPKDQDYAMEAGSFEEMLEEIERRGGEIYKKRPQYGNVRCKLPGIGPADFTLCRKDGFYGDHRRPDSIEVGTLYDDQSRRDFRCNSIAQDEEGTIYDPFNGAEDIKNKILRAVGSAEERLKEDPLRILRAVRFAITKDFDFDDEIHNLLEDPEFISLVGTVAKERVYEELVRCYRHSTPLTLMFFDYYHQLESFIFDTFPIRLEPKIYE